MKEPIKVGERVRAFHPGMFGVVKEGEVTKVGSVYLYIDFGELLGGVRRVRFEHVVSPEPSMRERYQAGEDPPERPGEP